MIKADVGFLTDQYLKRLLAANPLTQAKRIIFASDNHASYLDYIFITFYLRFTMHSMLNWGRGVEIWRGDGSEYCVEDV